MILPWHTATVLITLSDHLLSMKRLCHCQSTVLCQMALIQLSLSNKPNTDNCILIY